MTRRVTRSFHAAPIGRGGMPARWCASNVILVMLAAMTARRLNRRIPARLTAPCFNAGVSYEPG